MSDLQAAAQEALEAWDGGDTEWFKRAYTVMDALRAALAEPVQEPVAWMVYTLDGKSVCVTDNPADFTDEHRVLPLYAAPPQRTEEPVPDSKHATIAQWWADKQRTPLTDGQIHDCFQQKHKDKVTERRMIARAIEAAHGIKDA